MEVKIVIEETKEGNLKIKNQYNDNEIIIYNQNKEFKASEIVALLDYNEENIYKLEELTEEQKTNRYLLCIEKVLLEIIEKINNKE